jgi:hypothetical protein
VKYESRISFSSSHLRLHLVSQEPLVYINGSPYCLRRESFSLRNMKDYGGISGSRLEVLEERLKADVLAELQSFGGRCVMLVDDLHMLITAAI